jgi:hypothetical protein
MISTEMSSGASCCIYRNKEVMPMRRSNLVLGALALVVAAFAAFSSSAMADDLNGDPGIADRAFLDLNNDIGFVTGIDFDKGTEYIYV